MALPDVRFTLSPNGLGRPLDGKDHYSGMLFYANTYPTGFSVTNKINKVLSLSDVEALGIKGDYSNETKATGGNYSVSVASAVNGDKIAFKVTAFGTTITLYEYTFATGDTATTAAVAIRAGINAGTATHGFTAAGATTNVLLTAPAGYGIVLNTGTPLTATVTGTITAPTITQFSGGVNDPYVHIWYHCKRYFLRQPLGVLWLMIAPEPATLDFSEIQTLRIFAGGEIRLVGVYVKHVAYATSQVTSLQAQANTAYTDHMPIDIIYTPELSATALSALGDNSLLGKQDVVIDNGQDGANLGARLFTYVGKSIGSLGALLGTAALAKVSENLGWIQKFNIAVDDTEFNVPAFSNGVLYRDQSASLVTQLYAYHWTFIRTHIGVSGTYFVDDKTATADNSDYCTLENNRTIKKAIRNVRTSVIPQLSGPVYVDAVTGKLTVDYVGFLSSLANGPIDQMEKDGELNGHKVIIDPDQNVLATSTIVMTIQNVPVGVSRQFNINIGYVTKLS